MIVKMKKLNVVGLISQKKGVLDALRLTGSFELCKTSVVEGQTTGENTVDNVYYEQLHHKLHTLDTAISTVKAMQAEFPTQLKLAKKLQKKGEVQIPKIKVDKQPKQLFFHREQVSSVELDDAGQRGEDITNLALDIENQKAQIEQINSQFEQNKKEYVALTPYKNVDVKLSDIKDTKYLFMLLGVVGKRATDKVTKLFQNRQNYTVQTFDSTKKNCVVFVSGPIEDKKQTVDALSTFKFVECAQHCTATPLVQMQQLREANSNLITQKLQIYQSIACDHQALNLLKLYYDYIILEMEALDAQKNIGQTKKTFSIAGWIPAENADQIIAQVKQTSPFVECEVMDAEPDSQPPTLTRNNALVSPYEAVTNMYSPPNAFEADPNIFVAFFFFFFFGIMIGDAVYGVALFMLTFVLIRCFKMETGFKRLMMILCMGGVSAFLWGAVYNSWVAVQLPYNPILNPVEHPFDFLIISLGLGYVQIMFGFVLKLVANLRAKCFVDALADAGWKLLIMLGGMLNFPQILGSFEKQFFLIEMPILPDWVYTLGIVMIFFGLFGMLLTGGRHKKSIGGKILSGVGSWYDLVGILSDILSYCRLFGLALSGAIIGMVANILATDVLFQVPIVGYVLGALVSAFFHVFNLALACLGAYVHNSRLQFVEFFGKFYHGGGRLFKPMGQDTKYTIIKR